MLSEPWALDYDLDKSADCLLLPCAAVQQCMMQPCCAE